MTWSADFKQALKTNGGRVAVRLDVEIPPWMEIEIDASSIGSGDSIGLRAVGGLIGTGPVFDSTTVEVSLTEGTDFDNTDTNASVASAFADAWNQATNGAPALAYVQHAAGTGTLRFVGRQQTTELALWDPDASAVYTSAPAGFTVRPSLDEGRRTLEMTSVDEIDGAGDGTRALRDVRFGAESGEPVTREYQFEDSEAIIDVNPTTSWVFRWFPTFQLPATLYFGTKLASGSWGWVPVVTGTVARWAMEEVGVTYKVIVQSTWSRLSNTEVIGSWIHMHPLDIARVIIEEGAATAASSVDPDTDLTRSHFSVTRASDRWVRSGAQRDPWFDEDEARNEDPAGLSDEEALTQEEFEDLIRTNARVINADEFERTLNSNPPSVDAQVRDPITTAEALNEIALMMSGGFYEEPGGDIEFRAYDRVATADVETVTRWVDMTSTDDIYVSRVRVNFAREATARDFRQTFTLDSSIDLRGGEVSVDMPWVNALSEFRTPAGATIATSGLYREDVTSTIETTYTNVTQVGSSQNNTFGVSLSSAIVGVADVIFDGELLIPGATVPRSVAARYWISDSFPSPQIIYSGAARFITLDNLRFQIVIPRYRFSGAYTPQFRLQIRDVPWSLLAVRLATPDGDEAGGFLFYDDSDFVIANPMRGFSGARLRLDGTSGITASAQGNAALDESEGRRAYIQITSIDTQTELAVGGAFTVPPTTFAEGSELWNVSRSIASDTEIVVVDDWNLSTGGTVGTILRRLVEDNPDLRNEHPYFADSSSAKPFANTWVWDPTIDVAVTGQDQLRRLTPMRLRASIAQSYTDDEASNGRHAFGVGRVGSTSLLGTPVSQANAGTVPFAHQIALDVPVPSNSRNLQPGFPPGVASNVLPGSAVPDLYAIASDVTIPVYYAKTLRERFESGATQIEVRVPIDFGDVPMWSVVQLHAPDFHVSGTNGFSDGVIDASLPSVWWEVNGKRLDPMGDTPGVIWTLTALRITGGIEPFDSFVPPNIVVTPIIPPVELIPSGSIGTEGSILATGGDADLDAIFDPVVIENFVTNTNAGEAAMTCPDIAAPSASDLFLVLVLSSFSGGRITDVQYGNTSGTEVEWIADANAYVSVWAWDATDLAAAVNDSFAFTNNGTEMNDWAVAAFYCSNVDSTVGFASQARTNGSDPQSRTVTNNRTGSILFQFTAHADGSITPTINDGVAFSWSGLTVASSGGLWGVYDADDGGQSALVTGLEWGNLIDRATVSFTLLPT